jgi:hypothetical protein
MKNGYLEPRPVGTARTSAYLSLIFVLPGLITPEHLRAYRNRSLITVSGCLHSQVSHFAGAPILSCML